MSYFREARNCELSVIDYIETQINSNWTGITTVKAFQDAYKAPLPVVSIELKAIDPKTEEIGNTNTIEDYTINIDIFAKSNGQKIDLAAFILTQLKVGCVYYEYAQISGAPETLTKVANGRLRVTRFLGNYPVDFGGDGVNKYDEHRFFISVQMRKS